jgi:uncharacterized membrane protein YuzA (DUF378 family)
LEGTVVEGGAGVKVEWRTILGAATFLGLLSAAYWIGVAGHGHKSEASGIVMLIFGFCAYTLLYGYLHMQASRRKGIPRPEDAFDATMADGEGQIDYFPAASIWPAGMGLGAIFGAAGAVWGLWYLIVGLLLFFGAAMGWVVESDSRPDTDANSGHEQAGHEPAGHQPAGH